MVKELLPKKTLGAAYLRVADDLRLRIAQGEWAGGTPIPNRRDLARYYDISLQTLERAVSSLLSEGLLIADGRRGTFAAPAHHGSLSPAPVSHRMTFGIIANFSPLLEMPSYMSDASNIWNASVVHAMEGCFLEAGGVVRVLNCTRPDNTSISTREAVERLISEGVSGLTVVKPDETLTNMENGFYHVATRRAPIMCISFDVIHPAIPHTFYDNGYAGYEAAMHLVQQGYREILYIAPYKAAWLEERIAAAREAVRHCGLPENSLRVYPESRRDLPNGIGRNPYDEAGYETMRMALRDGERFTGIIATNDITAIGILQAATEEGKKAGSDFGLIGFDDVPEAVALGITSLRTPLQSMGKETARLLVNALKGENLPSQVRLCSELVPRRSTQGGS